MIQSQADSSALLLCVGRASKSFEHRPLLEKNLCDDTLGYVTLKPEGIQERKMEKDFVACCFPGSSCCAEPWEGNECICVRSLGGLLGGKGLKFSDKQHPLIIWFLQRNLHSAEQDFLPEGLKSGVHQAVFLLRAPSPLPNTGSCRKNSICWDSRTEAPILLLVGDLGCSQLPEFYCGPCHIIPHLHSAPLTLSHLVYLPLP